jgi:hypothetical protein
MAAWTSALLRQLIGGFQELGKSFFFFRFIFSGMGLEDLC